MPLFPILISNVCAFICFCKDIKNFKLPSAALLPVFHVRCNSPDFSSLISNPSIKLLLKGTAKSSSQVPDSLLLINLPVFHRTIISPRHCLFYSIFILLSLSAGKHLPFGVYGSLRWGRFTMPFNNFRLKADHISHIRFNHPNFIIYFKRPLHYRYYLP